MESGGVGQGYPQGGLVGALGGPHFGPGQGLLGGIRAQAPLAMGVSEPPSAQLVPSAGGGPPGPQAPQHLAVDPDWLFKELYDSFQDHGYEYMK